MTENNVFLKSQELSKLMNVSNDLIYRIIKNDNLIISASGNKKLLPPNTVRDILLSRDFNYKAKEKPTVINVYGMKGGIGKTSLSVGMADMAVRLGYRVLFIDLDMQGNSTNSYIQKNSSMNVLYDHLSEEKDLNEIIYKSNSHLDIIPSTLRNSGIEMLLNQQQIDAPNYFSNFLEDIYSDYDLIIMDCPPTLSKVTSCAIMFADINLIPFNADTDSVEGLTMSVAEIKRLENSYKKQKINIDYTIVFNKYDSREKLGFKVMGLIAQSEELSENLSRTVVRTDTAFKNAKSEGKSIFEYNRSNAKYDITALFSEIIGIDEWVNTEGFKKRNSNPNKEELLV